MIYFFIIIASRKGGGWPVLPEHHQHKSELSHGKLLNRYQSGRVYLKAGSFKPCMIKWIIRYLKKRDEWGNQVCSRSLFTLNYESGIKKIEVFLQKKGPQPVSMLGVDGKVICYCCFQEYCEKS